MLIIVKVTLSVRIFLTVSEPTVCPLPYVDVGGKYCFFVTLKKEDFADGEAICRQRNGFLARIDTEDKIAKLTEFVEGKFCSSGFDSTYPKQH